MHNWRLRRRRRRDEMLRRLAHRAATAKTQSQLKESETRRRAQDGLCRTWRCRQFIKRRRQAAPEPGDERTGHQQQNRRVERWPAAASTGRCWDCGQKDDITEGLLGESGWKFSSTWWRVSGKTYVIIMNTDLNLGLPGTLPCAGGLTVKHRTTAEPRWKIGRGGLPTRRMCSRWRYAHATNRLD